MLKAGLLSITFRQLVREEVMRLCERNEMKCLEWGGDIHVPHGDIATAQAVRQQCENAGIKLPSYGSYYRAGVSEAKGLTLDAVLDSASALGVQTVRVWAGNQGSNEVEASDWQRVADDLHRCCEHAAERDMTISLEYHGGTLTDTFATTQQLLERVDHPALYTYWQPRSRDMSTEEQVQQLEQLRDHVTHLHVFAWTHESKRPTRHPLTEHEERWQAFLKAADTRDVTRYAMLEFVKDDDPIQFAVDAATLRGWLRELA